VAGVSVDEQPWRRAAHGEAWVLTWDGETSAWIVNLFGFLESERGVLDTEDELLKVTAGYRVWPSSGGVARA